ncbi:General L-amino acid transport system permease protein aapQ [Vibrio nigripulchritudo SFn27]|uniref:General L-amino acid transport system permease protein aapQ n=1 Tax=Vibrio nigripulchritudo TaxID=28173 RepID=U4KFK3_9VIBR|nr:amino acid ABC transporter permease [Vibrio nigripulchritudo]CCN84083.1 General L-amino acid transport system permease protein aapQ [Vibrio nigripulchritudo BLFn1]CCN86998.1 General L-amino acid transport system permease protein aapQ [Vibrio nigripulchritudo SFn27]CCN93297.1 General L-amino acid transport system permease protein aapQ [Vibrio nigripulchritudo ENn2]CCO39412.1 General L-amino acid transport system permease protein aapQ [Vibrio nigripulchritudo SFn135]CCO54255.1 General L-amino
MQPTDKKVTGSDKPAQNTNLLYNPTFRSIVFQVIAVIALASFFYTIINNALSNLDARGIATGFDFLSQEAGFGIGLTLIEYDETFSYGRTFVVGLLNTALVSVLGIIVATVLGFFVGIARLSSNWLVSRIAAVYIEVFRNVPLLLQIFFWYFAVLQALPSPRQSISLGEAIFLNVRGLYMPSPVFEDGSGIIFVALIAGIIATIVISVWAKNKQKLTGQQTPVGLIGFGLIVGLPFIAYLLAGMPISAEYPVLKGFNFRGGVSILPELAALLIALSVYTASFIAEIVRSGINAVSHGQTEAAMALGLPRSKTLKLVVIPQALRIIIPPLTSQYLNLTKNSSLAMAIGYPDLVSVFAGTTLNQTGQAIEIIAMTMAVYLTLSLVTSALMNIYNRKVALVER